MCMICGCGDPTKPGPGGGRLLRVEEDLLAHNKAHAARIRDRLAARGVFALNLVSSPGSGKTTLLVSTIEALLGRFPVTVIEGDQETRLDADRIARTGAAAFQINTGRGCHLEAHQVEEALDHLDLPAGSVLFIENVGNLVCPAGFDLGEAMKVVLLSVTEGDDKPLKYADMFHAAGMMVVAKTDLLAHTGFDLGRCVGNARRINPGIGVLALSARTGEGMAEWLAWIAGERWPGGAAGREP